MSAPDIDIEELREQFHYLFNPDPDDFPRPTDEIPHDRLREVHGLDLSYLKASRFYGSSIHEHIRHCTIRTDWLPPLIRNLHVPARLMEAALRLFADSILDHNYEKERIGELHYYPPVILTFWSGFETFVKFSSEVMLNTVKDLPDEVVQYLREVEPYLDRGGNVLTRDRYRALLERYSVLLKYGYGYVVNRGSRHWQLLERAKELRDYYTHLDVRESRSVSSTEVLTFMEAVMLGIIWPSTELRRTQLPGIYRMYWIWDSLRERAIEYREQPSFMNWIISSEEHSFHCPFENVDSERFPTSEEESASKRRKKSD